MECQLTNTSSNIKSLLKKINWDFNHKSILTPNDIKPFDNRKFHWFPATYIPEIPFSLIEILTKENAVVYDPFAGSGTTYFQAVMLNRQAMTSDSSLMSIRYIKSLATLMRENTMLVSIKEGILKILTDYSPETDYISKNLSTQCTLLEPWFDSKTLNEIAFLYGHYAHSEDKLLKAMVYILLAGSIKNVCSQDRGYGYIADNVKPKLDQIKYRNLITIVKKKIHSLVNEISINKKHIPPKYFYENINIDSHIVQHNSTDENFLNSNSVDAIITSPPYPNMIDYSKSQRLLYYLFEADYQNDLKKEIGARAFRSRKNSIEAYTKQMKLVFDNLTEVLKIDGLFCLVLPHYNQTNSVRLKAMNDLLSYFDTPSYHKVAEHIRNISQTRKGQNTALSSLDQELIVIYRRIS